MTQALRIEMDEDVLLGLHQTPEELACELRLAAAVKWYEIGLVSQEKAARIAGVSRAAFLDALARFSVSPFHETSEEILTAVKDG